MYLCLMINFHHIYLPLMLNLNNYSYYDCIERSLVSIVYYDNVEHGLRMWRKKSNRASVIYDLVDLRQDS